MVIADRSVCDSFEEWYEKSRSIHHLLAFEPEVGLQIRNKSAQSKTEMEFLMSELSPHERLWINGGWKGFQTHLRSTQHNAAFTKRCGISVHSVDAAQEAQDRGFAYLQAGPIFNAFSKPVHGHTTTLISNIGEVVNLPIVAVGGITPERAGHCFAAGAAAVATISWVMKASSVQTAIGEWLRIMA